METKRVFSDDVIQRIASGIETKPKKISLDVLKDVLKPHQMRNVLGGYGYHYCEVRCNDKSYPVFCDSILDCEWWCYKFCGNGGWMTDCY